MKISMGINTFISFVQYFFLVSEKREKKNRSVQGRHWNRDGEKGRRAHYQLRYLSLRDAIGSLGFIDNLWHYPSTLVAKDSIQSELI